MSQWTKESMDPRINEWTNERMNEWMEWWKDDASIWESCRQKVHMAVDIELDLHLNMFEN